MSAAVLTSLDSFSAFLPTGRLNVLLVQPSYYSPLPPLGLLKLASYHRRRGDLVELVRCPAMPGFVPDVVYVTSLFTYAWKAVRVAVDFYRSRYPRALFVLGGIYASLLPDHAAEEIRPHVIWRGVVKELEDLLPAYDLVPDCKASVFFSSRGCIRRCPFCAVPQLEPTFEAKPCVSHLVSDDHSSVILLDNNFLASPHRLDVLAELASLRNAAGRPYRVDFNQGLDARLVTPEIASRLSRLKLALVRLAYDSTVQREAVRRAIETLSAAGIRKRAILVYVMFNYFDTPDDFLARVQDLMDWGVAVYPMRYQPLDALEKDSFVSPGWTPKLLEMVANARRVLGVRGTWPPYEALKRKFLDAKDLYTALKLREPKGVMA